MVCRQMPHAQEDVSSLVSLRGELSVCRDVLLQVLDKHEKDQIWLDDKLVLCRVEIVSTAKITRSVLIQVLVHVLEQVGDAAVDAIEVYGCGKGMLRRIIDKVSFKGNVLPAESLEAKRKSRGGIPLRKGGVELLDESALEICDAYCTTALKVANSSQEQILRLSSCPSINF